MDAPPEYLLCVSQTRDDLQSATVGGGQDASLET